MSKRFGRNQKRKLLQIIDNLQSVNDRQCYELKINDLNVKMACEMRQIKAAQQAAKVKRDAELAKRRADAEERRFLKEVGL